MLQSVTQCPVSSHSVQAAQSSSENWKSDTVPLYSAMLLDQCEHNVAVGCTHCKQIKFAKASVFAQGIFDNCGFCLYLGSLISIPSVHVSNTYCSGVFYAVQYYQ